MTPAEMQAGQVIQVAYVVRDLEAAMRRHWEVCSIGPWDIYVFEAPKVRDYVYRGRPATHSCLIAVTWRNRIQLELMQPVADARSTMSIWKRGARGCTTSSSTTRIAPSAVTDYARRGYPVIQSGRFDEDEHYYLDTEKDFGYIIELGNAGKVRPAERRYPQ